MTVQTLPMDPNNPNNPNPSSTPQALPSSPSVDQSSAPTNQIISDVTQIPPSVAVPPHASAGSPWGPPEAQSTAPANPWETGIPLDTATPGLAPQTPPTEALPSQATNPANVPPVPITPTPSETLNPFLQPQAGSNYLVPQTTFDQMPSTQPPPVLQNPPPIPNPVANTAPDPLNTAFSSAGSLPENPFAQPQMPVSSAPASPWETASPAVSPDSSSPPVTGFVSTPPENPVLSSEQPGDNKTPNATIVDQAIPNATSSGGTLDLSSLQNTQGPETNPAQTQPPGQPNPEANQPQGNSPIENAPTDLSHLIADDESQTTQPMGNVYTPPIAQDQSPGVGVPQTPQTEGGSAGPTEKHLNLTKVLLVAGIPIILIVAALSAYLILGIGRAAPEEDTSLPVEQTQKEQAPLTNPPQQIVAPSPATIPQPSVTPVATEDPFPNSSPPPIGPVATGSPTSAMEKLKARQASPSPTTSASPSADSLSLPQ